MPSLARVTIRDIAQRLGVSHVTVSLALKDHPRISTARREEVQRLAREMGYSPDPMLSSLIVYRQSKRPANIHSALAWINHWDRPKALRHMREFDAYWRGASESAERFGYRLDEFVWQPDMTPQRIETILTTRNIRGVLIPPHPQQPNWGKFHWENFSVIRFGLSVKTPNSHSVSADQFQGVVTALKNIVRLGYERIGFVVSDTLDRNIGGNYLGGFLAGQRLVPTKTQLTPLILLDGEEANPARLEKWLAKQRPDAILTTVAEIPALLGKLGLGIPKDIAVAGTSTYDISLDAGLNQNSEEIGRVAVETLISLVNANDRGKPDVPRRILIDGSWVDGTSMPDRSPRPPGGS